MKVELGELKRTLFPIISILRVPNTYLCFVYFPHPIQYLFPNKWWKNKTIRNTNRHTKTTSSITTLPNSGTPKTKPQPHPADPMRICCEKKKIKKNGKNIFTYHNK
jgi:hypothetical protein